MIKSYSKVDKYYKSFGLVLNDGNIYSCAHLCAPVRTCAHLCAQYPKIIKVVKNLQAGSKVVENMFPSCFQVEFMSKKCVCALVRTCAHLCAPVRTISQNPQSCQKLAGR